MGGEKPTVEFIDAFVVNITEEPGPAKHQLTLRFLEWCLKNEIYSLRMGGVGPRGCVQAYEIKHAPKIRAWLKEQTK